AGDLDVAIVYGPFAAARAAEEPVALTVTPLRPEVDRGPSLLRLSRTLSIGVRPQDESLRDVLNVALARRWDDVTAILDSYAVPRFEVTRPLEPDVPGAVAKVGLILPASTLASLPNAPVGDDARLGALVAENAMQLRGDGQTRLLVLIAHAPTIGAVERSARRLVAVDGVNALIGGYDVGEARILASVAAELGVPFFNVGSEEDRLRSPECYPTTFHIAPSTAMTLWASLATVGADAGLVCAVIEGDLAVEDLRSYLERSVAEAGATLLGTAVVEPGQYVYYPLLQEVAAEQVDTVLMLMS